MYLIVDGIDGRAHYVETALGSDYGREGAIVPITPTPIAIGEVDRTIAEIAAGNGGRYSEDVHWLHHPNASERFVQPYGRLWKRSVSGLAGRPTKLC